MVENNETARVVLVTGAARGIGRGIALRLAADGFDVAVGDLENMRGELDGVAGEIRDAGQRSVAIVADVSKSEEVEEMVDRVAEELGKLDVMVANAGIAQVKPLLDVTPEEFDRLMAVNLRGLFLCYQAAAQEWAEHGVTVNAYCPGIVDTAMWELIDARIGEIQGLQRGKAMQQFSELITLGRVEQPEDVVAFVSYLASKDSDYMSGQSVMIDGGIIFS